MRELLAPGLKTCHTLNNVYEVFEQACLQLRAQKRRERKNLRIAMVSGVVTSDGEEYIGRNLARLFDETDKVKFKRQIPVISAANIFDLELLKRLDNESTNLDYLNFWERILSSSFITEIHMAPGWSRSHGAKIEHQIANKLGLKICYAMELQCDPY